MTNKKIILKAKKILKENPNKYLYRNIGTIADKNGADKTSVLRAITSCKDIEIVFNEETYNPNSGPLFALKECVKSKAKESRILLEKEKEKKKKPEEKNKTPYKKPKQSAKFINKRRVKNCTKKFTTVHKVLDETLNRYSISLSKNDEEFMNRAVSMMSDFTSLIKDIIDKNDFAKYELEEDKK